MAQGTRVLAATLAIVMAAVGGSAAGRPAHAQPSSSGGAVEAFVTQLNQARDGGSTLTLATMPFHDGVVTVWTSTGKLPAFAAQAAAQSGIPVRVRKAPLSRAEISRVEAAAMARSKARTVFAGGVRITGVSVDFTGPVQVLVDRYTPAAAADVLHSIGTGYRPGSLVVAEGHAGPGLSRLNDSPPYYAGGRIKIAGGGECSAGWAGKSTTNHATYLLTSEHCVNNHDPRFWDGGNDFMGSATARYGQWDIAAIKVSSFPKMFAGAYTTSSTVDVYGAVDPNNWVDHRICTSGSFSGSLCTNTTINGYNHFGAWCTPTGACYPDLILWDASNNVDSNPGPIAGEGDSGGPVYINRSDTGGFVRPVGAISRGWPLVNGQTWCAGQTWPGRRCYSGVRFTDVYAVGNKWNLKFGINQYPW